MKSKIALHLTLTVVMLLSVALITAGCGGGQNEEEAEHGPGQADFVLPEEEGEGAVIQDPGAEPGTAPEMPQVAPDYYWPWLHHGILSLSSGEEIFGPDLFESDLGFIAEFIPGYSYRGELIWIVDYSDVFAITSASLVFDVDHFENYEHRDTIQVEFEMGGLTPEPEDDGLQEFPVNKVFEEAGFRVHVLTLTLGKEQHGSFTTDPINFIALDIEMTAASGSNTEE